MMLIIASATKAAGYTNWAIAQVLTNDFNGEPLIDQARLLANNILSVFIQENSTSSAAVAFVAGLHADIASAPHTINRRNIIGPDSPFAPRVEPAWQSGVRRAADPCRFAAGLQE